MNPLRPALSVLFAAFLSGTAFATATAAKGSSPVPRGGTDISWASAGGEYVPDEIRELYESRRGKSGLTARETETLKLLSEGRSNKEIASIMGVSEDGVKNHLRHINEKLDTKDRVEAVTVGIRLGILQAPGV